MTTPVRGRVSVHPRGFGFLDVEGASPPLSAFIPPPELNRFLDGDTVEAQITQTEDGRSTASGLRLLERWRSELFGTLVRRGNKTFLRVDRQVSNTDWPLDGAAPDLPEGATLVALIQDSKATLRRTIPGAESSVARVCSRWGLALERPVELEEAARQAARGPWGNVPRLDLREVPTVTIDAIHSKDLDDAVAVLPAGPDGSLRLLVSIADVDAFVPENSPLDLDARHRATSVYLAGRVLPMFPESLSNEAISLLGGVDRPALTVEIRIDTEGQVTSIDLYESLIRSHARLTYDAVAEFLATGRSAGVPPGVEGTVRWLRTAAARLSAFRASRGGVELMREEAYVRWTPETGEPADIVARNDNEAHRIIERLMVAANEAVARWLTDRGLPGVFRVHDEPQIDQVQQLAAFARNFGIELGVGTRLTIRGLAAFEAQFRGSPVEPALRTVMGRVLGPARYTSTPSLHFGLGAPLYLHFTSPIRRYADLLVHRIVKRFLNGDRDMDPQDPGYEELSRHINNRSLAAAKAENESVRMVAARLFLKRIGERVRGNVVAIKPFGLIVQMSGTGVSGTVALEALPGGEYRVDPSGYSVTGPGRPYSIGDALDLVVVGANEELGRIDLAPPPPALRRHARHRPHQHPGHRGQVLVRHRTTARLQGPEPPRAQRQPDLSAALRHRHQRRRPGRHVRQQAVPAALVHQRRAQLRRRGQLPGASDLRRQHRRP
jgi:ribonuclease R